MAGTEGEARLVAAARCGEPEALDELVSQYLPLVYNIVGRALPGRADVDDVVQETMLRMVRGLSGLRDDTAFRSWLVAVTMNQIRRYRQSLPVAVCALDELATVADPGADFADLTLIELGLTGQRKETVEATRWLDQDDRELLSLWWLVTTGHLTRAELVAAIGLDAHHVAVQVSRMKEQLEIARSVVRALTTEPRCDELTRSVHLWDGRPSPLWRKRLARHLRGCGYCGGLSAELVPAERLLVNLALVPLPLGLAALVAAHTAGQAVSMGYAMTASDGIRAARPVSHRRSRIPKHRARRPLTVFTGKPLVTAAAVAATVTAAMGIGALNSGSGGGRSTVGQERLDEADGETATTASIPPGHTTTPAVPPPAKPSPDKTAKPTPTPTPAHTQHPPSPTPRTPEPTPTRAVASPEAGSPEVAAAAQVLAVINQARADQHVAPLQALSGLESSAGTHNRTMDSGCGLSHQCPGEADFGSREHAAGVSWGSAGENIGSGGSIPSTTSAVAGMAVGITKSMLAEQPPNDGHRKNILNPGFHHIGIHVLHDSSGMLYMTQDFTD
ncbi:sigma-70 family RNA polymerase sigma factor [Streptomyces sp. NPDC048696]|uniref:sigma-70 family RNA polymerase sigma factor n=1 Tax=Streptomyces sp. NPDC048696 TaxID=3365585 RepID=UPI00370FD8C8